MIFLTLPKAGTLLYDVSDDLPGAGGEKTFSRQIGDEAIRKARRMRVCAVSGGGRSLSAKSAVVFAR